MLTEDRTPTDVYREHWQAELRRAAQGIIQARYSTDERAAERVYWWREYAKKLVERLKNDD